MRKKSKNNLFSALFKREFTNVDFIIDELGDGSLLSKINKIHNIFYDEYHRTNNNYFSYYDNRGKLRNDRALFVHREILGIFREPPRGNLNFMDNITDRWIKLPPLGEREGLYDKKKEEVDSDD